MTNNQPPMTEFTNSPDKTLPKITNPPPRATFTSVQIQTYLKALSDGHPDEVARHKAKIAISDYADLLVTIGTERIREAKVQPMLLEAELRDRKNAILSRQLALPKTPRPRKKKGKRK